MKPMAGAHTKSDTQQIAMLIQIPATATPAPIVMITVSFLYDPKLMYSVYRFIQKSRLYFILILGYIIACLYLLIY